MKFNQPNDPNAGRLVESLRHLGYGNYEALADIVDNSIDADAQEIHLRIQLRNNQHTISISDFGIGMTRETLDQAMRLDSMTSRDENSDLGKFGMGLVTASLSIARRCHVVTLSTDGCWSIAWDVDEIIAQNAFTKHLDSANSEEKEDLMREIGDRSSGTLVVLTKCDNLTNKNTSSFASNLKVHLGRVHRYFIESGRRIFVNGEAVAAMDPLQLGDQNTVILMDELIPVSVLIDVEKRADAVRVRIALVPEQPVTDLDVGKSLKNQGFYVLRNQREVMNANTLNFFTKHNDFNRMRGELFFPGTLDRLVGIEFTKRQVDLDQSLDDQLGSILVPVCRTIKRREATKKRIHSGEEQLKLHAQSIKVIAEKDKLLIKPKAKIERRSSLGESSPERSDVTRQTGRERKGFSRFQSVESQLNCVIREERLGPNGQIYECDMEGRKLVLRHNVEHPFYQRFVTDNIAELERSPQPIS